MTKYRLAAIAAVTFAFVTTFSQLEAQTVAPAGDAALGKAKFMGYGCYECHGTMGQGNYFSAPRIAPHPLPYRALISYIRRPSGEMPSYAASILPDKDVADIYAYLSSITSGKPASSIPALSSVTTKPK